MGSFSIWHWLIVFLALAIPAALLGGAIWLVVRWLGRRAPGGAPGVAAHASRLQELGALRSKGIITEAEYRQRRSAILDEV